MKKLESWNYLALITYIMFLEERRGKEMVGMLQTSW